MRSHGAQNKASSGRASHAADTPEAVGPQSHGISKVEKRILVSNASIGCGQ